MKKKETEIATNKSSGAEKVEVVEKEVKKAQTGGRKKATSVKVDKTVSAKGDAALGDSTKKEEKVEAKQVNARMSSQRAEAESEAAKARVQLALKKKEMQEKRKAEHEKKRAERIAARKKRLAEKKAANEKRLAERKALIAKRAAERKAQAEKRAAEREEFIRERAHSKANKKQARSKKKAERKRKKETHRTDNRTKGYGGWIAAVVALGVTTLALATTVTVGAVEMKETKQGIMSANRGTMYELTGLMEHIDDDLERVRISASSAQQSRILTDLLVQARLAEMDFEKMPISVQEGQNISTFINHTAAECERMLSKLRNGGQLDERDLETLERLYVTNHTIRQEVDGLTEKLSDKDLMAYIKGNGGMFSEVLGRLEQLTMEENRAGIERKKAEMEGAGMKRTPSDAEKQEQSAIDGARAAELCTEYFSKYKIEDFQCVGETATRGYSAYNVQGYDEKGTMLFAEIDRNSGNLIGFDYYEECTAENFDIENAERIAEEFLDSLGYDDMELVKCRESGSTAEFTFVYEEDGAVYYPDEIRVKVCRTRGVVTGMDASKYLRNHRGRDALNVKIDMGTASEKLSKKLSVETSRLALVRTARGERAAYEFLCSYDEGYYFVYIDAETGEELAIINAQNAL